MIGTLRASGYTRRELLLHYLSLPVLITILSAVIGNILGYTAFKDVCAGMYYGSYSLPTYQTRWNANAFLLTTVIPAILMFVINAVLISGRLRLSPLRFLRHDFAKKGKSHAVRLPNFRFFSRFRLRILLQNKSSYFTLFLGIIFANILLLFGMMMKPLLSHYQTEAVENMLADYQYILNVPDPIDEDDEYTLMGIVQKLLTPSLKTNTEGVETFALTSLKNIPKNREGESISVYGIQKDSKNVSAELFEDGVTISDGYAEKYGMKVGDTLELKEPYEDKTYSFEVKKSIYAYPGALAVFLPMDVFCEKFDHPEDYFNGYFSNEPITDLEESYIATKITEDDMTKDFTTAQCVDGRNVPADQCFLDCTVHAADLSADEADHREEYDFDFDGKDSRLREQGNFESVFDGDNLGCDHLNRCQPDHCLRADPPDLCHYAFRVQRLADILY